VTINIVRSLPEESWRRFVADHPQGNIFHTPEMFQVFGATKGHRPELWAATTAERILALWLPVQITLKDGVFRRMTTRSVVYGGVLCAAGAEGREALRQLLRAYVWEAGKASLFTEVRNTADLSEIQPLLQAGGFVYEDHLNYLINLDRSPTEILDTIGSRTRKNIRRGLRKGTVEIEIIKERADVTACHALLSQTYNLAQIPLADFSLFQSAFDVLHPKNMVRFTVARIDRAIAAVSIELLYKRTVYGWYGGLNRNYSSYAPNELLMWHILEWGAQSGYQIYDFGGAGRADESYGVRDFKAKFGGDLVCFGRNIAVHAPVFFRLSRRVYPVYRRLIPRASVSSYPQRLVLDNEKD